MIYLPQSQLPPFAGVFGGRTLPRVRQAPLQNAPVSPQGPLSGFASPQVGPSPIPGVHPLLAALIAAHTAAQHDPNRPYG